MIHYVNANGWYVAIACRDWRTDVTDGPDVPVGTVLATMNYQDWEPVAMWKIDGDDHTSAVPLTVEDENKLVEMGTHVSDHREIFYILKYSPDGAPARLPSRDVLRGS